MFYLFTCDMKWNGGMWVQATLSPFTSPPSFPVGEGVLKLSGGGMQ